eukprot:1185860-Prorocentrum_minimum.AAC.3
MPQALPSPSTYVLNIYLDTICYLYMRTISWLTRHPPNIDEVLKSCPVHCANCHKFYGKP